MDVDWNSAGTLKHIDGGYDIRTDALKILVSTAMQGHEGEVSHTRIDREDGTVIRPDRIRLLAKAPGRIRWKRRSVLAQVLPAASCAGARDH